MVKHLLLAIAHELIRLFGSHGLAIPDAIGGLPAWLVFGLPALPLIVGLVALGRRGPERSWYAPRKTGRQREADEDAEERGHARAVS